MDYYRSPCSSPAVPGDVPPPDGRGRRRGVHRGGPVLLAFVLAIGILSAVLLAVRIFGGGGQESWSPGTFFPVPSGGPVLPDGEGETAPAAIPRAEPDPSVQLVLSAPPDRTLSYQEIYEKALPSIVSVRSYFGDDRYQGTGVIMDRAGYLITNHHVIAGCTGADVVLSDGRQYQAKLVGSDAQSDLAVLKIDAEDLTPAEFGDSGALRVGDAALAIGNPLGSELFGTMTDGIISALSRDMTVSGYSMNLIQTTAALNPGNSGGALLNSAGQVVGITNMKMMSSYETIEGLGFAIPTAWAKEVVDALMDQGVVTGRPTLGITGRTVQPGEAEWLGQSQGVFVVSVLPQGPAAQAGILPGDVILAANGQPVSTLEELSQIRDAAGVGGTLELQIWHAGAPLDVTLTLMDQYEVGS